MSLYGTMNTNIERNSRGFLYLLPVPATLPTGASLQAKIQAYFDLFISVTGWDELDASILPYANITADGLQAKFKQNQIIGESNAQAKHPIGIEDLEATADFTIIDVDPKKFADLFSLDTDEFLSIAASSSAPGYDIAALGGQTVPRRYIAMWRAADGVVPGEYEMFLWPRVTISPDTELKLNKKDRVEGKFTLTAEEDFNVLNARGFPEKCFYFKPTAAKTA